MNTFAGEEKRVIVIGAGGHAGVLISTLQLLNREIIGILDPDESRIGKSVLGINIIGPDDRIFDYDPEAIEIVNGIGSVSKPERRRDVYRRFKSGGYSFATVVHPTATIARGVDMGEGVQIMAGAVVQCGSVIGENVIINTGAIIDHDCVIGEHVHVAPGVVVSGEVHVGASSHIGTGATIIQGRTIGREALIGAGSVVISDIPPRKTAIGVPARIFARCIVANHNRVEESKS
jgi:UDP-perosamine 4-acetyltransferase